MTIRQKFTCDMKGCPSREWAFANGASPEGWVMYRKPTRDIPAVVGWTNTKWFCSTACLSAFLDAMPPAAGPSPGTVFTCDACGKEVLLKPGEEWPFWVAMKVGAKAFRKGFCSKECVVAYLDWEYMSQFLDWVQQDE